MEKKLSDPRVSIGGRQEVLERMGAGKRPPECAETKSTTKAAVQRPGAEEPLFGERGGGEHNRNYVNYSYSFT